MSYIFQYCYRIRKVFWMLTQLYQSIEYLIDIGKIKVSGKHKVTRTPIVFAHNWVYVINIIVTECTIAQVSKVEFAGKRQIGLCPYRIVDFVAINGFGLGQRFMNLVNHILYRINTVRAFA